MPLRPPTSTLFPYTTLFRSEMRHGWQMSYLLCTHFGDEGKREAAKLLERRADEGERLLGSFNEIVDNRSEEHTSELQSHHDLVCRLLLEKKNQNNLHHILCA